MLQEPTLPWSADALLPHAVPFLFLLGAAAAGAVPTTAWPRARAAAGAATAAAFAVLVLGIAGATAWTTVRGIVLLLIGFVGWALTRYAGTFLDGEPGQPRFVRALLGTLAGASLVVATNHLAVLVVAWLATSLALQRLLTFYADRPAAQMAAHKKFLVSRAADACMVAATALLVTRFGTLDIDELTAAVAGGAAPETAGSLAVVLIATAALLKTAQLPFHGWLMQVMEAPTPVSALLHAGVVNLGGFVLIRLHALVAAVPAAQGLLVVVGSLTAVLAGLVATTRISIKVGVAWSTCAQMGFMVLQCGLGLHEMALLHLVAHSLYKANAFLTAGTTVHHAIVAQLSPREATTEVVARCLALAGAAALGWLAHRAFGGSWSASPAALATGFVVALALVPLVAGSTGGRAGERLRRAAAATGIVVAWFALHHALHGWIGAAPAPTPIASALAAWTIACFALLFVAQTLIAVRPDAPVVRRLHAWFFGGLFLDEWFTRLTLRLWPADAGRGPSLSLATKDLR